MALRTICGENVLNPTGIASVRLSSLISLNDTATYLWKSVEGKDFTADDLVKLLLDRYDVDKETAAKDVEVLIGQWKKTGAVTE